MFVLNYCLTEFLLSTFANSFELRCEPKQLMPLYYEICPFWRLFDLSFLAKIAQITKGPGDEVVFHAVLAVNRPLSQ